MLPGQAQAQASPQYKATDPANIYALAHACMLLRDHRAIDDTLDRARHYGQRAIDAIAHFPAGEAKSALTEAVEFAIARAY